MIKTEALTKKYGRLTAVDGLDFQCERGEVLGFMGPNGAGKSTTMRMIAGFVPPTSGRAEVCGYDVWTSALDAKRRFGYLPEGAPSYAEMTPGAVLDFVADVRGLSGETKKSRISDMIDLLHLEKVLGQPFDTLSKGFKRRVGLAQAILHDPEVLILDEPTDGLDPNQKHEVRELILSMADEKLIVISTHILEEVEAVCNRAIIIADGRILADDSPEMLASRSPLHNSVRIIFSEGQNLELVSETLNRLDAVSGTLVESSTHTVTAMANDGHAPLRAVADLVNDEGWNVSGMHMDSGRLEDVFREITRGSTT